MIYTPKRNDAKTRYLHIDNFNLKNANLKKVTVGYRILGDYLVIALSKCHKEDKFVKKVGNQFVDARLDSVSLSEDGGLQLPLDINLERNLFYISGEEILDYYKDSFLFQDVYPFNSKLKFTVNDFKYKKLDQYVSALIESNI